MMVLGLAAGQRQRRVMVLGPWRVVVPLKMVRAAVLELGPCLCRKPRQSPLHSPGRMRMRLAAAAGAAAPDRSTAGNGVLGLR